MRLQGCSVLVVEASGPDPKRAKASSAAFNATRDGITRLSCSGGWWALGWREAQLYAAAAAAVATPSCLLLPYVPTPDPALGAGFAVQHASGALVVVTGPAALYPFLTQDARQHLAGATHASLVPGARLVGCRGEAIDPCITGSWCQDRATTAERAGTQPYSTRRPAGLLLCRLRGYIGGEWVPLRLVGLAEAPGARDALARLLAAASVAGPGGWRVGWPQAKDGQQQAGDTTISGQRMTAPAWAAHWASLAPYVAVLEAEGATAARQLQEVSRWRASSRGARLARITSDTWHIADATTMHGRPAVLLQTQA